MNRAHLPNRWILTSVACLVLCFEPFKLYPLAWIALIPWFEFLYRSRTRKEALTQSFWLGFLFSFVTFFWVALVIREFGFVPLPLALCALVLFSIVGQPQFLLGALFLRWVLQRFGQHPARGSAVFLAALTAALFYSGLDWCLPKLFVDTLGHSQVYADRLKQIADLGGPALITALMVFFAYSSWDLASRFYRRNEPSVYPALSASLPSAVLSIILIVSAIHYGGQRIALVTDRLTHPTKILNAGVIQANIGDIEKIAAERGFQSATQKVMQTFYDLSDEALALSPKPDVLIWPETSYPSNFRKPDNNSDFTRDRALDAYVKSRGVSLIFGGYDQVDHQSFNTIYYLEPSGNLQLFHKNILLPFGEFIPGADAFPWIKKQFPMVGFFGRGPGPVIIPLLGVKTAPLICYEALFPAFTAESTRLGAELIMNVTNDSWFGTYGAPYYHLNLASFRSIETRTPQIRSTNTGISALILPDGRITNRTPLFEPKILNVAIPMIEPIPTLVKRWGDWFAKWAFLLSLLIAAGVYYSDQQARKSI